VRYRSTQDVVDVVDVVDDVMVGEDLGSSGRDSSGGCGGDGGGEVTVVESEVSYCG
jgi:hypothetical protein